MKFANATRSVSLGTNISVADSPGARRTGLLNRKALHRGDGLWITQAFSIHTFGMRFPIDVVFLDSNGRVVGVSPNLQPGRWARHRDASSVIELPSGTIESTGTGIGDEIQAGDLQRQTQIIEAHAGGNACL